MGTNIRPEVAKSHKYYISKHRYYELKHFCLQYKEWQKTLLYLNSKNFPGEFFEKTFDGDYCNPTADLATARLYFKNRIDLVIQTAKNTDLYLWEYILKAVTEGLSYVQLSMIFDIPCSRDTYYDRYRKFFWLLDDSRK